MNKKVKLPTIIGIIILVIGLAAGVLLIQYRKIFSLRASPDQTPQDVRITNITDKSFSVSWITDKTTVGYVMYGESNTDKTAYGAEDNATTVHNVNITGLKPQTSYSFKINSDGAEYDNSGIAWKATTGPALSASPSEKIISGTVLTASGEPASKVLVYVNTAGGATMSTTTSANGSWIITIGNMRVSNLSSYHTLDDQAPLEVFVQAGTDGVATAQVLLSAANPVSPIILGQTHDFRGDPANNLTDIPDADIGLPEDSTPSSGFDVPEGGATPSAETVTLESIDPGEVITTTEPEFFGEGPPGTEITITVESDPITDSVTVATNGEWNWSPPAGLAPGSHTVTLQWRDASGILRTLERTFIVEAADNPAFVSTPSATPRSSATPKGSPSPTPKASATPKGTATPSATPRVTKPATDSGTPVAGVSTPTIMLALTGISLLALAGFAIKKSLR